MQRFFLWAVVCIVMVAGSVNAVELSSLNGVGASDVLASPATNGLRLGPIQTIATLEHFDYLRADETAAVWSFGHLANNYAIQAYDFQRKELVEMNSGQPDRKHLWPDVSGRTVVWSEDLGTHREIFSYDLDSQQVTPLITGDGISRVHPRIDGNVLVWGQYPVDDPKSSSVWGARGPGWEPFPIDVSPTQPSGDPEVDGDHVAYLRDGQVIVSNLETGDSVFTAEFYNSYCQLVGNYVAWETRRSPQPPGALVPVNHEIANMVTGQHWTLEGVHELALSDGFAVYHDYEADPGTLVAFDLTDGSETILRTIDTDRRSYRFLALAGQRLVWMESGDKILAANIIVPEPSTLALLVMGVVGVVAYGWRRRSVQ